MADWTFFKKSPAKEIRMKAEMEVNSVSAFVLKKSVVFIAIIW